MKIYHLLTLLTVGSFLFGQTKKGNTRSLSYGATIVECKSLKEPGFSVQYLPTDLKVNTPRNTLVRVKLPSTSNEIIDFNEGKNNPSKLKVNCFPFLNGIKIHSIEMGDVELISGNMNNIKELKLFTNLKKATIETPGGKEFCVKLQTEGISEPGVYKIIFKLKAKIKQFILPINTKCEVENFYLRVVQ